MSEKDIYGVTAFNDEEARNYISLLFDGYQKRKQEKRLYVNDGVPEIIIKTYYNYVKKPDFSHIVYNFKRRYIYNESKLEDVHTKEEKDGLACVYKYIQTKEDLENISIYDLSYINEQLFIKTPYPDVGGKYRNEDTRLSNNFSIELCPYWYITHEMNLLKPEVEDLVKRGLKLGKVVDSTKLMDYINDCVKLKCKIVKIHPFLDGNGRSARGFLNLLFRLANIPPVYVENKEKEKYKEAMNNALAKEDYDDILGFYHFKICDSIMALDVNVKEVVSYSDSGDDIKKVK